MITDSENLTDSGDSTLRETARFIMVRSNTLSTVIFPGVLCIMLNGPPGLELFVSGELKP